MITQFNEELVNKIKETIIIELYHNTSLTKEELDKVSLALIHNIAPHYEKQIAELKEQIPQWLPISTAPKDEAILLYNGSIEIGIWFDIDKWREEIADRHKNNHEWLKNYFKGIENHKSKWVTVTRQYEIIQPTLWKPLQKPSTQGEV